MGGDTPNPASTAHPNLPPLRQRPQYSHQPAMLPVDRRTDGTRPWAPLHGPPLPGAPMPSRTRTNNTTSDEHHTGSRSLRTNVFQSTTTLDAHTGRTFPDNPTPLHRRNRAPGPLPGARTREEAGTRPKAVTRHPANTEAPPTQGRPHSLHYSPHSSPTTQP